ncbi:M66 family metalloprotease [Nocardia sp. CDC159]|uniref:M66 family metalloprotease n=1 Tax=Nocardia pulmonis TaxID=2951408 RepID=A0A9X2IYH5_9NOCA|nr:MULTISPECIES: M66 family metalloprotease [Nocardia]MCM6776393.1 M66 family metalloprotease [Nocardia pulmonis]MCM6788817.1 M66 family metalloprotease [Nocardia sp. CDC159]
MSTYRKSLVACVALLSGFGVALTPATSVAEPQPQPAALADSDGDGLADDWELKGYDANGDGRIDVDLPAMGANPRHKDIFVEMDYMNGRLPSGPALDRIVDVFAAAPVANPDGRQGIAIHLDAGNARGAKYNLGGGNQVPYDNNLSPVDTEVDRIKGSNFNRNRSRIFHYMIWADSYNNGCSSGISLGIPADTFVVSLGPKCGWNAGDDHNVGTFIHELGHNLGLRHGGTDHVNYKPNYLSVMNYSFQFSGVPLAAGGADFGYSSVNPAALNESALNEGSGLGQTAAKWKTVYFCPDNSRRRTANGADKPIDWNCSGGINSGTVRADVNNDDGYGTLRAQNNWASLVFDGGDIGTASPQLRMPREQSPEEMTKEEFDRLQNTPLHEH